ncbi:MAG TPA: MlaD family protein, partial [Dissulfurispiraceae bacterium]
FVILSGFVILIGGTQVFEKFDTYYVKVMNAAGLEVGAQVKLGGVRVGRVLNIIPPKAPSDPVTLAVGVRKGTTLYRGTRALITQIGFVGDIYLLLSIDNTSRETLTPGDVIPAGDQVDFGRLMARLDSLSLSVAGLIKDVDMLFSSTNVKRVETLVDNTNRVIISGSASIDRIATGLNATTEKLRMVLDEVEGLVHENRGEFAELIKQARTDLEKASIMIQAIESAAKSVDRTSGVIGRTVETQSQNMDDLFSALTRTTEELQEVLKEIKHRPWRVLYREAKED